MEIAPLQQGAKTKDKRGRKGSKNRHTARHKHNLRRAITALYSQF